MSATTDGLVRPPEFLAETEWLEAHLDDPSLIVLDCTTHLIPDPQTAYTIRSGRPDFETGHIPGAQFVDLQADLSDNNGRFRKFRFMMPAAGDLAATMGRFGVGEDSVVVLYSSTVPQWAARTWWVLRNYGFDNAAVLNGGFKKWMREGRLIETGPARPRPTAKFVLREDRMLMAGKEAVISAIGDPATCTINAQQPEQFAGTGGNTYGRPGRIKKSVNVLGSRATPPRKRYLPADIRAAGQICIGWRSLQTARDYLLRRRHRGQRRCACAGYAWSPRCAALRRLNGGMGVRSQSSDGVRLVRVPSRSHLARAQAQHAADLTVPNASGVGARKGEGGRSAAPGCPVTFLGRSA